MKLTWENELLPVFVVVGRLRKKENITVSAAPERALHLTNGALAATCGSLPVPEVSRLLQTPRIPRD